MSVGWTEFWSEIITAANVLIAGATSLLFQPWALIQIVILLVLLGATRFAAHYAEQALESWVRGLETTRTRLRLMAILLRRLHLVLFVAGSWLSVFVIRTVTWPSRSYLIGVAASIATVWLATSLIGRFVKNRLAERVLTVTVVVLAAFQILGLLPTVTAILNAAAITAGGFRLSLLTLLTTTLVLGLLLVAASLLSGLIERRVQMLEDLSPSMQVLAGKLARVSLFVIALVLGLQTVGLDLTTLTVFSGAIGLGLGFGLQKVVSNLISGVILLLDKSVKPGDVIEVGNTFGWIVKLGARFVSVVTRDGREYLIPNEDLITSQVVNWSHSDLKVRMEIEFGVSYEADPLTVRKVAIAAAGEPRRVLGVPAPVCHLCGFGESSVDYVLRFWIADPRAGVVNIKSEVLIALWYALKEQGISIPYPRRDLDIREPVRVTLESPQPPVARARSKRSRRPSKPPSSQS